MRRSMSVVGAQTGRDADMLECRLLTDSVEKGLANIGEQ